MRNKKVVVLDVVGLTPEHFTNSKKIPNLAALQAKGTLYEIDPVFPAVTLTVQASMTTGLYPDRHGIISNGSYSHKTFQTSFWEQPSTLVEGERIWEKLKRSRPETSTALLFMQNTLFAESDVIVTPKPMHTDEGLVQWCYSKPVGYYEELTEKIGAFCLMHYWGPMTSIESSRWIASAAIETIERKQSELMFVYLPHLDYCLQKFGPDAEVIEQELEAVDSEIGRIVKAVEDQGLADETVFLVVSEYAMQSVSGDIAVNRVLRNQGLLKVREINGREYLDFELSPAFAMVDHQVAHIYIKEGYEARVRAVLEKTPGIAMVLGHEDQRKYKVRHGNSGDLIIVSARDKWFSYYWWEDRKKEPDFATHVDIHRKPGYDPLELCLDPQSRNISQDTSRIKGSHGYPALAKEDKIPLLVSGALAEDFKLPVGMDSTSVFDLIEKIVLS